MHFLRYRLSDAGPLACGVNYLQGFLYNTGGNGTRTLVQLAADLEEAKTTARAANIALLVCTTSAQQTNCHPILEAAGFEGDFAAKRPNQQGYGHSVTLWSYAVGGSETF